MVFGPETHGVLWYSTKIGKKIGMPPKRNARFIPFILINRPGYQRLNFSIQSQPSRGFHILKRGSGARLWNVQTVQSRPGDFVRMPDMARRVQKTGRTGWYYRVVEAGIIEPGQPLRLIDRPHPEWPLSRVLDVLYRSTLDLSSLETLADLACLAPSWRALFRRRLTARSVESWSSRLDTPPA